MVFNRGTADIIPFSTLTEGEMLLLTDLEAIMKAIDKNSSNRGLEKKMELKLNGNIVKLSEIQADSIERNISALADGDMYLSGVYQRLKAKPESDEMLTFIMDALSLSTTIIDVNNEFGVGNEFNFNIMVNIDRVVRRIRTLQLVSDFRDELTTEQVNDIITDVLERVEAYLIRNKETISKLRWHLADRVEQEV